jgi:hypothetical protein
MSNPLNTVVREVRALTPSYPLADFQAKGISERQATKFLERVGIQGPPVEVSLVAELPRVEVIMQTSAELCASVARYIEFMPHS